MSFGYAVGDVIAVLGLFERIAVELRSYKDAPAHFQNLSLELDLIHNTLQQVIHLDPQDDTERETLEQVRVIVLHCQQPLQAWANKMRSKETSLGHFRSTNSLSSIGTRIHWSMVAKKDVDELRRTILSEMGAIMLLMGVRQTNQIKRLATKVADSHNASSSLVRQECGAISRETSKILSLISNTPEAISDLRAVTTTQSEQHLNHIIALDQGIVNIETHLDEITRITANESSSIRRYIHFLGRKIETWCKLLRDVKRFLIELAKCSTKLLSAIRRNTMLLLDIISQLKKAAHLIEAIPLHLTLDLVRLDDALGESWALPLQACQTYESFCDILRSVVYANNRPGLEYIKKYRFTLTLANKGIRLDSSYSWERYVKAGTQIEQAIIASRQSPATGITIKQCLYPGCNGSIARRDSSKRNECLVCGRWTQTSRPTGPIMHLCDSSPNSSCLLGLARKKLPCFGPKLRPIRTAEETSWQSFRRVVFNIATKQINTIQEAERLLSIDPRDPAACTFVALTELRSVENDTAGDPTGYLTNTALTRAKQLLEIAVEAGTPQADTFYLLGRVYTRLINPPAANEALRQAAFRNPQSTDIWNTIAILYFAVRQYRDSLDALVRAISVNPGRPEPWYNLAILYGIYNQPTDMIEAISACLERNLHSSIVKGTQKLLQYYDNPDSMVFFQSEAMIYTSLQLLPE